MINFDDFTKLDLKTGKVLEVNIIPMLIDCMF
jgi:hypothetical protein